MLSSASSRRFALLIALSVMACGCAAGGGWPPWLDLTPLPNPSGNINPAPVSPAQAEAQKPATEQPDQQPSKPATHRHKRKSPVVHASPLPVPPSAEPAPAATPIVTLSGEDVRKDRAAQLLTVVEKRLSLVNRTSLSDSQAGVYAEAAKFVAAGRQAEQSQDYEAARGFAEKASVLANKLSTVDSNTH